MGTVVIAGPLLNLGFTVAIISMLVVYYHQPTSVLRYGITMSGILSVLSTIPEASLKTDAM